MQKANAGVILAKLKRITGGWGDEVMGEELYHVVFTSSIITHSLVVV